MKTSKEMKELMALADAHRGEKDERLRLITLKETHRRVMSEIGNSNIDDPGVQKKMADATLGLALVEARLAKLQVPNHAFDEIDSLHKAEGERYNRAVVAARAAAFETLISSQLPFFEGDDRACRKYWETVRPPHPMFYKFSRALHHHPSGPRAERDVVQEVSGFLAKRERHGKALGIE
jgi:hypothetical protein